MKEAMEKELANAFAETNSKLAAIRSSLEFGIASYTDFTGVEFGEAPACYNGLFTEAMARDMSLFHELLAESHLEASEKLGSCAASLSAMNHSLEEKTEDISKPWDSGAGFALARELKSLASETEALMPGLSARCMVWADRALYMNTWAVYLDELESISGCQEAMGGRNGRFLSLCCDLRKNAAELFICTADVPDAHVCLLGILDRLKSMCGVLMNRA